MSGYADGVRCQAKKQTRELKSILDPPKKICEAIPGTELLSFGTKAHGPSPLACQLACEVERHPSARLETLEARIEVLVRRRSLSLIAYALRASS